MTLQAIVKALDRTKSTAQHMFRGADVDGSGYLSAREIELLLRDRVGLTLSSAEVQQLIDRQLAKCGPGGAVVESSSCGIAATHYDATATERRATSSSDRQGRTCWNGCTT